MSVRKWNKWPAHFKIGAASLLLLAIILSATLVWSWSTYVELDPIGSVPYDTFIQKTLSSLSGDTVTDIKYKSLGKSFKDGTFLATIKLPNKPKKEFVIKILSQGRWLAHRQHIMDLYIEASSIGLSPKVFFTDPDKGILILEYIPGRHISFTDLKNLAILKRLAQMLKQYHIQFAQIPPCPTANSLSARVGRRLEELQNTDPVLNKIKQRIESYADTSELTITHNDLKISNILITPLGRLYIIDWGEAHTGNPIVDLASLSHHGDLTTYQEQALLKEYFHRDLTQEEKRNFLWYKNLSLLHTAAWAARQSYETTISFAHKNQYNPQRFKQLLRRLYQEGSLSKKELKEIGTHGILCFLENTDGLTSSKS